MKFIRIYIEIGDDNNPIYANEFLENAKNDQNILIASKEYVSLLEKISMENVYEIPEDIMLKYDKDLQTRSSRYIMMKIYNNDQLKDWIAEKISVIHDNINGVYMRGEYSSIIMAARECQTAVFIQNEVKPLYNEADKERNYQLIVDSLERRIQYLDTLVKQNNETIESMKASIESNNNYINNLQIHATNLDNDLRKYKQFYEENHEIIENVEYRVKHAEDESVRYITLYKNLLSELDKLKTEKLELEQKLQKK